MTAVTQEEDGARKTGGSPVREYVVLEQMVFEEDPDGGNVTPCFVPVHTVQARNGNNALRKAFKELRELRTGTEEFDEGVLVCVPAGQWKPTPVRAKKRESVTIDVG